MSPGRLTALLLLLFSASPYGAVPAPKPPKLAVLLVVDQMRADYIDRFQADWTGGLKRLVAHGAWFRNAAYPYLDTVTCAGHATVSTGAFPHTHGILSNSWWDRQTRELVTCTEDKKASPIGYGKPVRIGDGPSRLLEPALADELRAQRRAHVVSLSLKARSAIMLAGAGGDAVTWLNETSDGWATSSAYAKSPVEAVKAFVEANPIDADFGKTWTRLLPESRYQFPDDGEAEAPPRGWTRLFPHPLTNAAGKPDPFFYLQWEASPFADSYLARMGAALAKAFDLGKHDGTDLLAISFSSTDLVGHAFGPRSQEVQDMYAHLDRDIGALLDTLDSLVGRDEYVVALTADHGVSMIPEQARHAGRDAGRIMAAAVIDPVEQRLEAVLGPGKYVARLSGEDLYFTEGVYDRLEALPEAMKSVVTTLSATPGVARVFRRTELRDGARSNDPLLRAAALSYFEGRSGDLVIALKPGWMFGTTGTTHGNASEDDERVPIVLMGRGIKPGRYAQAVTPADVAPTLAALSGVTMPNAEGHVLHMAIAPQSRPSTSHPGQR